MAACDNGEDPNEDGHFYCSDGNGNVIDESYCDNPSDDDSGGGFFFVSMGSSMHAPPSGHSTYPVGSKLPAGAVKSPNTVANRTRFGLPARGRISNGTVKTGVIGKGGPGSSVSKPGSGVGKGGGGKGGSGGG